MNMQHMKTYSVPTTDVFRLGPKGRMMQSTANSNDMINPAPVRFPED